MTKKNHIMTMALDKETKYAIRALEKAGVQVFVETLDMRDADKKKWNEDPKYAGQFPPEYVLQFYTLDPTGI